MGEKVTTATKREGNNSHIERRQQQSQREKATTVTKREGNNSHKERRQQQSQREKVTTVTKREGNNSHIERRDHQLVKLNCCLIEPTAFRGWGGFAAPKQARQRGQ